MSKGYEEGQWQVYQWHGPQRTYESQKSEAEKRFAKISLIIQADLLRDCLIYPLLIKKKYFISLNSWYNNVE